MRSFIHRYVWQRLPRHLRREMLFRATELLAPSISEAVPASEPIIVVGAFQTATGLGESARLCYACLRAAGLTVHAIDIGSLLNQPLDLPGNFANKGWQHRGPGTLILHVNAPLIPLALLGLGRKLVERKRVIGYWAWELPELPRDWRPGLKFVHQVWVPSKFTASAIKRADSKLSVQVVPHPVAVEKALFETQRTPLDQPFTVLIVFNAASSFARKNPLAAISAFQKAFGSSSHTRLLVKAINLDSYPEGAVRLRAMLSKTPNAILMNQPLDRTATFSLYGQADAVISLHRSEGFGLVPAEGMLAGRPVISTDWSGPTDFLNKENGVPVGYKLVAASDPQGFYEHPSMTWAEPDVYDAAGKLNSLLDRRFRTHIGARAQRDASEQFSAVAYVRRVAGLLEFPSPC